jgi:hypothetical protein
MAGKKNGFLTEPQREFLRSQKEKRLETYSESQIDQFDNAIREQGTLALADLILIAREYDEASLQKLFSKEAIENLIGELMDRIGLDDAEGDQHYYEIILNVIEHRIHEKYRELDRFFKLESTHYPVMPRKPAYRDVKAYMKK